MKILVTGGRGMLGRTIEKRLAGNDITIADLPEWDITDSAAFAAKTSALSPDVVIHCAAMTKVDDCESKRDLAFSLNAEGSRNVALASAACGARLIAVSTDYVFSGDRPEGEEWSESDAPSPATVYGESKLAGEREIAKIDPSAVILRTAWLYGPSGPSFVHTMAALGAKEGGALKVVSDQRGNPTSTTVVADVVAFLLGRRDIKGVVHATCEGTCSWYDFACAIKRALAEGFPREIVPCSTAEFPRPAPRPANSALAKGALHAAGYRTPRWEEALGMFIASGEFSALVPGKRDLIK